MKDNLLERLLVDNKFTRLPNKFKKVLGIDEAELLTDLIIKFDGIDKKDLKKDGSFYKKREYIEKDTGFSYNKQRRIISKLEKFGLLSHSYKDVPRKVFYKLNIELLEELMKDDNKLAELAQKIKAEKENAKKVSNTKKEKKEAIEKEVEKSVNEILEMYEENKKPQMRQNDTSVCNEKGCTDVSKKDVLMYQNEAYYHNYLHAITIFNPLLSHTSQSNKQILRNICYSDFDKSRSIPPLEISDNRVVCSAETEIQNSGVNNTNQENKKEEKPKCLLSEGIPPLLSEENTSNKNNIIVSPDTTFLLKNNIPQSITEGNTMSLPIKDTNSLQLPVRDNIPLAAEKSIRQQIASNPDALKPESKYKAPTEPRMNEDVKSIINLWETLGLHKSKHTTNSFKEGVKAVYSIINGTLFQDDSLMGRIDKRIYSISDIELSIRNFAKAALDPNYLPEGKYKNTIKKYALSVFFHNKYAKTKSLFIHYLENEPQLLNKSKVILLEDKHEDMTRRLRDYYLHTIMGGISIKLSIDDENHFILGSKKLLSFYKENGARMLPMELGGIRKNLTNWLCESLSEKVGGANDYNISNINPSWFSSDITFNKTLPKYLLNQSIYEIAGVSMSNKNDDINPHDYTNDDDDEPDYFSGKYSGGIVPGSSFTEKEEEEEDAEELANQW